MSYKIINTEDGFEVWNEDGVFIFAGSEQRCNRVVALLAKIWQ